MKPSSPPGAQGGGSVTHTQWVQWGTAAERSLCEQCPLDVPCGVNILCPWWLEFVAVTWDGASGKKLTASAVRWQDAATTQHCSGRAEAGTSPRRAARPPPPPVP